jgi:hypothetical protein
MPVPDQLTPYWDTVNQQFQGPGNVPAGSVEILQGSQLGAGATVAVVPLGIASRAGKVADVRVAAVTPLTGNATYTVDIKKNGVTVLTAPMALLAATPARGSVVGVLAANPTNVVPGDFFEAAVSSVPGTGAAPANIVFQVQLIQN